MGICHCASPYSATKQILDSWGEDGWELVTITPGMNPENVVAYFKRPLEES